MPIKFLVLGGGRGFFGRGGWQCQCQFCFYGRGDFPTKRRSSDHGSNALKNYLAIWGIAATVSQYRAIGAAKVVYTRAGAPIGDAPEHWKLRYSAPAKRGR